MPATHILQAGQENAEGLPVVQVGGLAPHEGHGVRGEGIVLLHSRFIKTRWFIQRLSYVIVVNYTDIITCNSIGSILLNCSYILSDCHAKKLTLLTYQIKIKIHAYSIMIV